MTFLSGSRSWLFSRCGVLLVAAGFLACGPKSDGDSSGDDGSGSDDGSSGDDGGGGDDDGDGGGSSSSSSSGGSGDDGSTGDDGGSSSSSGGPDWSQCEIPPDCVLAANDCCGPCGAPQLGDVDAVNKDMLEEHFDEVCPDPNAEPCPGCPSAPNPFLIATCDGGHCHGVDLKQDSITECVEDIDCRLRTADCCECGGNMDPWSLIAIAVDAEQAYASLVCDPDAGCPECAPVYPEEASAYCDETGHCAVLVEP